MLLQVGTQNIRIQEYENIYFCILIFLYSYILKYRFKLIRSIILLSFKDFYISNKISFRN